MPFLYHFEVRDSGVEGKGLFALEDIPKQQSIGFFKTKIKCRSKGILR